MEIKCLQDLMERGRLRKGDVVWFRDDRHVIDEIETGFYACNTKRRSDSLLIELGMTFDFIRKCFGHEPTGACWPVTKKPAALTRLVAAIYCKMELFVPEKNIEIRFNMNGKDVTDSISEETKQKLLKEIK